MTVSAIVSVTNPFDADAAFLSLTCTNATLAENARDSDREGHEGFPPFTNGVALTLDEDMSDAASVLIEPVHPEVL